MRVDPLDVTLEEAELIAKIKRLEKSKLLEQQHFFDACKQHPHFKMFLDDIESPDKQRYKALDELTQLQNRVHPSQ